VNSTETPGGPGIPAGWYDDPSGQGLRWWDGEQWTEHVHTAESAAAAAGEEGAGDREAPPPQLVKLRESIQAKGAKGVGMVLGGAVLAIVVIALLLGGGGSDNSGKAAQPGGVPLTAEETALLKKEIKALNQQLNSPNLPKAEKKSLEKQLEQLEKEVGISGGGSGKKGKSSKNGKSDKKGKSEKKGKGKASKEKTPPGEEGN
jgi:hypothetical protein